MMDVALDRSLGDMRLEPDEPVLIDRARTQIQPLQPFFLGVLDPFPDQQIIRFLMEILGMRSAEFIKQRFSGDQKDLPGDHLSSVIEGAQENAPVIVHELFPNMHKESLRLRKDAVFIFS